MSVRPSGITLTLPLRYPLSDALAFVDSKADWIVRARERVRKKESLPRIILPPFRSRLHELKFETGGKPGFRISKGETRVCLSPDWAPEGNQAQQLIKQAVTETFRAEAKQLLPARVAGLAARHGLKYTGLAFRNTVSRWGSCSSRNSISLSVNLMLLPDHLIDYIILHELCHTVHKNHGPKFHALLDRLTDGLHRRYDKELKNYTPRW